MSTKHPPSGPTEQEVREHFGDKLKADSKLMRPAYTSIWALEDGTLLWDWRNGFAELGEPPKPAKSAERHSVTPQGIIAGQREQIIQQREEIAQLKKELAKYRIDLSLYKSI